MPFFYTLLSSYFYINILFLPIKENRQKSGGVHIKKYFDLVIILRKLKKNGGVTPYFVWGDPLSLDHP